MLYAMPAHCEAAMLSTALCICPVILSSLFLVAWCWRLGGQLQALARVSTLDPLTGLPNGLLFEAERWPAAMRSSLPLAVLFIDLDHLKLKNDRYGRLVGDRYILRATALLRQACRRGVDPIFRLHTAGDEFAVLLFGDDALYCETVAQHILCTLVRGHISASIGVAWTRAKDHRQRGALLDAAEQAMRRAKGRGKGRIEIIALPVAGSSEDAAAVPEHIDDDTTAPRRIETPNP
jgi:diguanylate cyclase (GGDEF)-like protein